MRWTSPPVHQLIHQALTEDAARQDITSQTLIPANFILEAQIRAKASGVVCGLPLAQLTFKQLDPRSRFTAHVREGQAVTPGTRLATIRGKARAILAGERTALNAVQHLS